MSQFLCHDFKTPRTDMSRRLPGSMRIVPVLFYGITLTMAYFAVKDFRDYREAEQTRLTATSEKTDYDTQISTLQAEKSTIETERFKGEALAKWVESTRVLQPVSVAIARSIPPEANIVELAMERVPELPAQVSLTVRMMNATIAEVPKIESSIARLHYRSHQPQQAKQGDQIEYKSMLVWQE